MGELREGSADFEDQIRPHLATAIEIHRTRRLTLVDVAALLSDPPVDPKDDCWVKLELAIDGSVCTRYARLEKRFKLKRSGKRSVYWKCPYCPEDKGCFEGKFSMVPHITFKHFVDFKPKLQRKKQLARSSQDRTQPDLQQSDDNIGRSSHKTIEKVATSFHDSDTNDAVSSYDGVIPQFTAYCVLYVGAVSTCS